MEIERLLDHSDWVRKLASNLVNDEDEADDLVQETWKAALESPPRDADSSRSWLGRVLRNFAYSSFRRRKRRSLRERAAASAEAVPSPEASMEKLETARLLIDLVFALEEPGRTAVVLRYFEGLTSREIARRLDTSPGAVRMRLKRALGSLRGQLVERGEERGVSWKSLLLPILGGGSVSLEASGAEALGVASRDVAAVSTTASGAIVHTAVMATVAVSCFVGGLSVEGWNDVAVAPGPQAVESPAAPPAVVRLLESRIEELEARLETSRERVARKNEEIRDLKTKLAAHVTAGAIVFDPA